MNGKSALYVAGIVVGLDYIFHLAFTIPMEVPAYFGIKFFIAYATAYLFLSRFGLLKSSLIFTILFSVLYYGVLVYVLGIPGISVWNTSSTFSFVFLGTSLSIYQFGVLEFFVHAAIFYVGGLFARVARGNSRHG